MKLFEFLSCVLITNKINKMQKARHYTIFLYRYNYQNNSQYKKHTLNRVTKSSLSRQWHDVTHARQCSVSLQYSWVSLLINGDEDGCNTCYSQIYNVPPAANIATYQTQPNSLRVSANLWERGDRRTSYSLWDCMFILLQLLLIITWQWRLLKTQTMQSCFFCFLNFTVTIKVEWINNTYSSHVPVYRTQHTIQEWEDCSGGTAWNLHTGHVVHLLIQSQWNVWLHNTVSIPVVLSSAKAS